MTAFLDASALTALIDGEPERAALEAALDGHRTRLTSGLALWETARAIGRRGDIDIVCRKYGDIARRSGSRWS